MPGKNTKQLLMIFAALREVIITTNRLNDYILGETVAGTRKKNMMENLNQYEGNQTGDHGWVMLPQRQTDADTFVNEFTDCTVHNKADVIADIIPH